MPLGLDGPGREFKSLGTAQNRLKHEGRYRVCMTSVSQRCALIVRSVNRLGAFRKVSEGLIDVLKLGDAPSEPHQLGQCVYLGPTAGLVRKAENERTTRLGVFARSLDEAAIGQ